MGDRLELKANLLRVAKLEPEPTRAEKLRDLARQAADYLSQVDYDAYFDTLIPPSGKQEKEFTEFSLSALKESKKNLEAFLRIHKKPTMQFKRQIAEKTLLVGLGSTVFREAKYTSHEVIIDDAQIAWFENLVETHPSSEGWKMTSGSLSSSLTSTRTPSVMAGSVSSMR